MTLPAFSRFGLALLVGCIIAPSASAQTAKRAKLRSPLTLDQVLDEDFSTAYGESTGQWQKASNVLLETRSAKGGAGDDIVVVDPATGAATVLVPAAKLTPKGQTSPLEIEHFDVSPDRRRVLIFTNSARVWRQNTKGDYWVYDIAAATLHQLGATAKPSSLMFAKLSPDGTQAGYVQENDLYSEDLKTGKVTRLTKTGSATLINGTFDWVYEEELDLRDGWRWSPDSKHIAFWQLDTHEEPIYTLINDTDGLYPTLRQFPYPKAGQKNASARVGIVNAGGGKTTWVDDVATPDDGYLARMSWTPDGAELIVQRLNRLQNEDKYELADATTGKTRVIFTDSDSAWVDTAFGNDTGELGVRWIDGGKGFLALSERDGWRHLYSVSRDGKQVVCLTPGNVDIEAISGVDDAHRRIYFIASPDNPVQRYLYQCGFDGSVSVRRVTPSEGLAYAGTNSYLISPDGSIAIHTHSAFGTPSNREVVDLPDHKILRVIADGKAAGDRLAEFELGNITLTQLPGADGSPMDVSLIYPPNFDPNKRYPLFFEVYGEPAAVTVRDEWGGRGYMFMQLLAQKGYIVASVDNRGTPSLKGREWRKSVYKKIGIVASDDQAAAVKKLLQKPYIDPSRVGIWGWSGGGSMTLNMLFRYPELYKLGMSVAPVPDTRLYDTIYQERYMGLPQTDSKAYTMCSPISFAKQLKGDLLIVHGSGDDNVHYQGTEKLVNVLVENNLPFQEMIYPNRSHGIYEGEGTTRHLYELLVRFLTTHMPPGGR